MSLFYTVLGMGINGTAIEVQTNDRYELAVKVIDRSKSSSDK